MHGWENVVAYLDNPVTTSTKVYAVAYNGDKTEVSFWTEFRGKATQPFKRT